MPTTTFDFETFDAQGYTIDTHSSFFLPSLTIAKEITEVRVIQSDQEVGQTSTYDILVKSPYPVYSGDALFITVPEQASKTLGDSFRSCNGSSE